jgi:hypothetical protein
MVGSGSLEGRFKIDWLARASIGAMFVAPVHKVGKQIAERRFGVTPQIRSQAGRSGESGDCESTPGGAVGIDGSLTNVLHV